MNGDSDTRSLLAQALSDEGVTVDEAGDADAALGIVAYALPDVVVYALGWGAGLHQLDVIEHACEDRGAAPAVVLTTPAWARASRGVTLRGPIRLHELVAAIEGALHARTRD